MIRWIALSVVLLAMFGCGGPPPASPADAHEPEAHSEVVALSKDAIEIGGIDTSKVEIRLMQARLQVPGVVIHTDRGRTVVTPPVAGKILALLASIGDVVTTGQPLAIVESIDLAQAAAARAEAERASQAAEAEVKRSRSEFDLARARLQAAKAALDRQRAFAQSGAFSQPALQAAQRELNEAESELDSARREEVVHRAQLERAERLFKGELISRTDLENARLDVEQDQIRQDKAKRQIALAQQAHDREQKIARLGLQNAREIQLAESELRASNLEVGRAKIALEAAGAALRGARQAVGHAQATYAAVAGSRNRAAGSRVTLVAPSAGVVAHRDATLGQAVERTTELFEIDSLGAVWVTARVPEKQVWAIRRGQTVRVRATAFPDQFFPGVVQVVSSRLDPKTRTMPVQCLVQNPGGLLRPDMFARVELGFGPISKALVTPRSAVVADGDERVVFVAEEAGKFERRVVRIGREEDDWFEILEGLKEGERVVTKGAFILKSEAQKGELKGHEH